MISKTVRRMLAVSLAAVMAVGAMAGCGKEETTADPTKAPENTGDNQEVAADPTTAPVEEEEEVLPEYVVRTDANGKNIIGLRLKLLRENAKLSQRGLAEKLQLAGIDMDKNVITRIETNKRYVTDFEIQALKEIFNVSYDYLIDGKE